MDAVQTDTALIDPSSSGVQVLSTDAPYHPAVHAGAGPADEPLRMNGHAVSFDDERARLEAEIEAARARIAAAQERRLAREADARRAMRAEVEATRRIITELEQRHAEALALIEETAELEIARLRSEHEAAVRADADITEGLDGGADRG